jgi:hypothetical protein
MNPLDVVVISDPGDAYDGTMCDSVKAALTGQWFASFADEYGLSASDTTVRCIKATSAIAANPNQAALEAHIGAALSDAGIAWKTSTLGLLFLPPGIDILDDSTNTINSNCSIFGGYHTATSSSQPWGVAQRCDGYGANQQLSSVYAGSHELVEAATDPVPNQTPVFYIETPSQPSGTAWSGEVGDLCVGSMFYDQNFPFQRVWSNIAAARGGDPCVPALSEPYFNVSADTYWTEIPSGGTATITMHGWSTAATDDWLLSASPADSTFTTQLQSARTYTDANGNVYPRVNNSESFTMTVTAPQRSHVLTTITVYSFSTAKNATDEFHQFPIGVYIP